MKYKQWIMIAGLVGLILMPFIAMYFVVPSEDLDWGSLKTTNYMLAAIAFGVWMRS